ncbi:unnamed protein product [Prorocentrum cordatum]|uniref:Uncharacterized protein n=1 Tax=Prorocentrum cordatum TaxID=2364126 RepID=A0ABN9PR30_9DINO|nr:unnamed protein product [Polarella glacialis]
MLGAPPSTRHVLVWYDADDVYHERSAVWPQTREKWAVLTPDLDMHAKVLDGSDGSDGVTRILDLRPGGRLPILDAPPYRFTSLVSFDDLEGCIREGCRLALQEGAAAGNPPIEMLDGAMPD